MEKNINKKDDRMKKLVREIGIQASNYKYIAEGTLEIVSDFRHMNVDIERRKKPFINYRNQKGFRDGLYHAIDIIYQVISGKEEFYEGGFHEILEDDDIHDELINFTDEIVKFKQKLILMESPKNEIEKIFNKLISEVIVINSLNLTRLNQHYSLMFKEKEDYIYGKIIEIIMARGFILGLYFVIECLIDDFNLDDNKYLKMRNKVFRNKTFSQLSEIYDEKNLILLNDIEQSYNLEWL